MRLGWVVIAACACGNQGDKHDSPAGPVVRGLVRDSHGAALAYTIELPRGLVADPPGDGVATGVDYVQKDHVANDAEGMFVMVSTLDALPATLDEAVARTATDDSDEIVRKERIERGFIVESRAKDRHTWSVEVMGAKLRCRAEKKSFDGEVGPASGRLLERICLSLAPAPS